MMTMLISGIMFVPALLGVGLAMFGGNGEMKVA